MRGFSIAGLVLIGLGACLLIPELDAYGYFSCESDEECQADGRVCAANYCSPPPWWDNRFQARNQLVISAGDHEVPAGLPVRLTVGPEPRALRPSEMSPSARLVVWDRLVAAHRELPVTVDVLDAQSFDAIFGLPGSLAQGQTLADVWLYTDGVGVETRSDARQEIYAVEDAFEADTLDPLVWETQGAASLPAGDGEVSISNGGYLWSTSGLPGSPGVILTALFEVTPASACTGLAMGLMDNATAGYRPPYAVLEAHRDSENEDSYLVVQAATGSGAIVPDAPARIPMTNTLMRVDLLVSGTRVAVTLDGTTLESFQLDEPVTSVLRAHFFVEGGSCTLRVKQARMRSARDPEPAISAGRRVEKP
jgi:hypothetical protein